MLQTICLCTLGTLIYISKCINTSVVSEMDLTDNLFANLNVDPRLTGNDVSESSVRFIDRQIENYISVVKRKHGVTEHSLTRRSLPIDDLDELTKDKTGVYLLDGFIPLKILNIHFPRDVCLFRQKNEWYAAALEATEEDIGHLVIYKYNGTKFVDILRTLSGNGSQLGVHTLDNFTLIIVAGNEDSKDHSHSKTAIFEFKSNEKLTKIQSLESDFTSDIAIWENHDELYFVAANKMSNINGTLTYKTNSIIYKWLGKHFDATDQITTYGCQAITTFSVGRKQFLAVANSQDDKGETNIFSEIYKYDLEKGRYTLHQKILTKAAADIKYFHFGERSRTDSFLVVANSHEKGDMGAYNYDINSIVYKYVDDYFIPFQSLKLNGAMEWLPVEGTNKEFALLVKCKYDGIRAFFYDGWRFIEREVLYAREYLGRGIDSMRYYIFNNEPVIVVANEDNNGDEASVFQLKFSLQNELQNFQNDVLDWCNTATIDIEEPNKNELKKIVGSVSTLDKDETEFVKQATFADITLNSLRTLGFDARGVYTNEAEVIRLQEIEYRLDEQLRQLQELEVITDTSVHISRTNIVEGNIFAENVVLNNDAFFESLITETINHVDSADFLQNVVNANEDFIISQPMELGNLRVEGSLVPKYMNGKSSDDLVRRSSNINMNELLVAGNATLRQGIILQGKLNGVNFSEDTILLHSGDQLLSGDLHLADADIKKAETNFLNKLGMSAAELDSENSVPLTDITNLTAKNVVIEGFINEIDLPTLDKYALRTYGNQVVTSEYVFDNLQVNAVLTDGLLSGREILKDFISIKNGSYEIGNGILFIEDLSVDDLVVIDKLNQIAVINGKLDILFRDATESQHITGYKKFGNMDLLNPFASHGKLKGLDYMNPITMIEKEITMVGNYVIAGNTTVEKLLQAEDIRPLDHKYSLGYVAENGLQLTAREIPFHVEFLHQLNVEEIYADTINHIELNSLIVNGNGEAQYVRGWKKFLGDVYITGNTFLIHVNDIRLPDLETNVLTIAGDQEIIGKHHIRSLTVGKMLSDSTSIGNNRWSDIVLSDKDQYIAGVTLIDNSVELRNIVTESLRLNGAINTYNFTYILNDSVHYDNYSEIKGHKRLGNLKAENLKVKSGLDMDELPKLIESSRVTFRFFEDVDLPNNIRIENMNSAGSINGIASEDFRKIWLKDGEDQVFYGVRAFDSITIYNKADVDSGQINHVPMADITVNTIKTDEPFQFEDVTFSEGIISANPLILHGEISGLDLENIVPDYHMETLITAHKVFGNNVTINGTLQLNGLINGVSVADLCEYISPTVAEDPKELIVNGIAHFSRGPLIKRVNGILLDHILENTWLSDRETKLRGYVELEHVAFQKDVHVDGLINEINLDQLARNYFSKTRNQTVAANLDFTEGVNFGNGVFAPEARLKGRVFNIDLGNFVKTAVLNGSEQVFESTLLMDVCNIKEIQGEYLVNDLNLQRDVMRYDTENIVTGRKSIPNVMSNILLINRNFRVQNVDVLKWIQHAILKYGSFAIQGCTTFNNDVIFSNGFGLIGSVNGYKFDRDSVMLYSREQNLTGKKSFFRNSVDSIKFEVIKLKDLLNKIDLKELMHHQAFKDEKATFQSHMILNTEASVRNLNIGTSYNNVNVSQLIYNLTNFAGLNNYYNSYASLLNVSNKIKESFKYQSYFLDYYKVIQDVIDVKSLHPMKFHDGKYRLAATYFKNDTTIIDFFIWDSQNEYFVIDTGALRISFPAELLYITSLEFAEKSYLFIETVNMEDSEEADFMGNILSFSNNTALEIVQKIPSNGTKFLKAFTIEDRNLHCVIITYYEDGYANIYCETDEDDGKLEIYQQLPTTAAFKAVTVSIEEITYIFVINSETNAIEAHIDIWKLDENTGLFNLHQLIYVTAPKSISVVFYKEVCYLAVASGHLQNVMYPGIVEIKRFDSRAESFVHWQDINLQAPINVEFAILPTRELVLYVVTDSLTEPLVIYVYEGISGFVRKITATTTSKILRMDQLNLHTNEHIVVAQSHKGSKIIKATFKGHRYE